MAIFAGASNFGRDCARPREHVGSSNLHVLLQAASATRSVANAVLHFGQDSRLLWPVLCADTTVDAVKEATGFDFVVAEPLKTMLLGCIPAVAVFLH